MCHLCKLNIDSSEDFIIQVFQLTLTVSLCIAWLRNHLLSFYSSSSANTQFQVHAIIVNLIILSFTCKTLTKIMAINVKYGEYLKWCNASNGMDSSRSSSTSFTSAWKSMSSICYSHEVTLSKFVQEFRICGQFFSSSGIITLGVVTNVALIKFCRMAGLDIRRWRHSVQSV